MNIRSKLKSVSVKVLGIFFLCMLAYSISLFIVIKTELQSGLIADAEDTIKGQEETLMEEVESVSENLKTVSAWLTDAYVRDYDSRSLDKDFIDGLCSDAINYYNLTTVAFFDANGDQLSDLAYGDAPPAEFLKITLNGVENYDLINAAGDIYSLGAVPIKINGSVVGCIFSKQQVTSDEFVRKMNEFTGMDVTVFNGYTRHYTSILGGKDTNIEDKSVIDKVMSGENLMFRTKINGYDYLVNYFPLTNAAGTPITTLFLGEQLVIINDLTQAIFAPLLIFVVLVTIALIVIMVVMLYRLVIVKLNFVKQSVENLSSGDADLTMRIPIKGNDEFADVGNGVNKFVEMLQQIVIKLNNAQKELAAIGDDLGANSQQSASATAEIMANIDSVRNQSKTQAEAVNSTTQVLQNSDQTVEGLVELINEQVKGIADSSAAIEEMLGNIKSVTDSVRKMGNSFKILGSNVDESNVKIDHVTQKVTQMAEQSKMLIQANQMIASVASQTNLLAMNAAIEAAHAGEAGRGFSVVADEIRKLAETSSAQSKNINNELKTISQSIQDVVALSSESKNSFETIVTQLSDTDQIMMQISNAMEEQEVASQQILESLSAMKSQASEVNDKSVDLKNGVENVESNMSSVSQISEVILGSMDEMATGSQQINEAAQSVSGLALQTKNNIGEMSEILSQFKV